MDRLLENDSWNNTIQLGRKKDSISFLNYMYPEKSLLPNNLTLENLLELLEAEGLYGGGTKGKRSKRRWTHYPPAVRGKNSDREAELAMFFNKVRAGVHRVCGVSCL